MPLETLLAGLEAIYNEVRRASGIGFRFSREDRRKHRNSHTFYMAYEGPLPGTSGNEVKVDVTIKERIVYPLEERNLLRGCDEYSDLPRNEPVMAYPLEEIALEKTASLMDPARCEPRDLYDLWYLTSKRHVDLAMLLDGIRSKLEFHGLPPAGAGAAIIFRPGVQHRQGREPAG
jgi:predicted nucleotidyltransferase component of viral defense system